MRTTTTKGRCDGIMRDAWSLLQHTILPGDTKLINSLGSNPFCRICTQTHATDTTVTFKANETLIRLFSTAKTATDLKPFINSFQYSKTNNKIICTLEPSELFLAIYEFTLCNNIMSSLSINQQRSIQVGIQSINQLKLHQKANHQYDIEITYTHMFTDQWISRKSQSRLFQASTISDQTNPNILQALTKPVTVKLDPSQRSNLGSKYNPKQTYRLQNLADFERFHNKSHRHIYKQALSFIKFKQNTYSSAGLFGNSPPIMSRQIKAEHIIGETRIARL